MAKARGVSFPLSFVRYFTEINNSGFTHTHNNKKSATRFFSKETQKNLIHRFSHNFSYFEAHPPLDANHPSFSTRTHTHTHTHFRLSFFLIYWSFGLCVLVGGGR